VSACQVEALQSLVDLLPNSQQRSFLAEHGMHAEVDQFLEQLTAPESDEHNDLLGLQGGTRLVHIGQQVCTDYHPATLTKFKVVTELSDKAAVEPAILWHDADRADSEKFGMRIVLPNPSKPVGVPLAPRSEGIAEPRFIQVAPAAVDDAFAHMDRWASGRNKDRSKAERIAAKDRLDRLAAAVRDDGPRTLGEFNVKFAGFLLREALGLDIRSTLLSRMIDAGMLTDSINAYLNSLADVIAVFNEAVDDLVAHDIDPQVKQLPPDHLPLHYSCPTTNRRVRLSLVRDGEQHLASSDCRCGTVHSFPLGTSTLSIAELAESGRWTADVSLPIHLNRLASGWVVGRSTAIYGIVLNSVVEKVFGYRPIPGLIPPSLMSETGELGEDTLLVEYLTR
jgi:hypothetical protein